DVAGLGAHVAPPLLAVVEGAGGGGELALEDRSARRVERQLDRVVGPEQRGIDTAVLDSAVGGLRGVGWLRGVDRLGSVGDRRRVNLACIELGLSAADVLDARAGAGAVGVGGAAVAASVELDRGEAGERGARGEESGVRWEAKAHAGPSL